MKEDVSAKEAGEVSLGGQLSVPRLGFGAMRIIGDGIFGPPKDRQGALAVLRRAVELGVRFIDTADLYGPNVSEELISEALFPYPQDLVIATKGGWLRPGPNQWTHDASPAHLRKAIEGSLKRLRLHRIDLYQLHVPDPVVPFEDSVENSGPVARGREDPSGGAVERHQGTHRASPQDRADRVGAEPIQFRRSRVGLCRGLLRAKRHCFHSVVPAGSRQSGLRDSQSDREGAPANADAGCTSLAASTLAHHAAYSGNDLD